MTGTVNNASASQALFDDTNATIKSNEYRKAWVMVERERGEDTDGNDNFTMVLILLISTYFTLHLHLVLLFMLVLILLSSNLLTSHTLLYTCI